MQYKEGPEAERASQRAPVTKKSRGRASPNQGLLIITINYCQRPVLGENECSIRSRSWVCWFRFRCSVVIYVLNCLTSVELSVNYPCHFFFLYDYIVNWRRLLIGTFYTKMKMCNPYGVSDLETSVPRMCKTPKWMFTYSNGVVCCAKNRNPIALIYRFNHRLTVRL